MVEETSDIECNYWIPLLRIYKSKKINIFETIKMNQIGIQLRPIWKHVF